MKKLVALFMMACILISANVGFAMSQKQLNEKRQEMADSLAITPTVTYNDLLSDEQSYVGKVVKFKATCVGTDDPKAYFYDNNGRALIIISTMNYKLKLDTEYEISATFKEMRVIDDGSKGAYFTYETAHLPFMSEYFPF